MQIEMQVEKTESGWTSQCNPMWGTLSSEVVTIIAASAVRCLSEGLGYEAAMKKVQEAAQEAKVEGPNFLLN